MYVYALVQDVLGLVEHIRYVYALVQDVLGLVEHIGDLVWSEDVKVQRELCLCALPYTLTTTADRMHARTQQTYETRACPHACGQLTKKGGKKKQENSCG